RQDLADILAHDPDHDQLHAAEHHQAHDHRGIARDRLAEDEGLEQDLHAEDEAAAGGRRASRPASRKGATRNEVRPSIESAISEYRLHVVRPWMRSAGS